MNLTDAERREVLAAPTAKERKAIFNRMRKAHRFDGQEVLDEEAYWDAAIDALGPYRTADASERAS